ncbi:MAG: hypothetical protein WAT26_11315, partial [Saprospiraceae bacterium]
AVVASGVIGRFIYLQIPRTIQGRELSLHEVQDLKSNTSNVLSRQFENININTLLSTFKEKYNKDYTGISGFFAQFMDEYKQKNDIKKLLITQNLASGDIKTIMNLIDHEMALGRKIQRLVTMQKLFRYWHIAHLPFALIMLIIMIIHVVVAVTFGYTWIF